MNRVDPQPFPLRPVLAAIVAMGLLGACSSTSSGARSDTASAPRAAPPPSGHTGCFDPALARGYQALDDDVLLVDAGRNFFRVQLEATCFGTDWAPELHFVGDPITGRICGRFGERIIYKSQSCMIERVDWITPDEHARLLRGDDNPANDRPESDADDNGGPGR